VTDQSYKFVPGAL